MKFEEIIVNYLGLIFQLLAIIVITSGIVKAFTIFVKDAL